jgi:kynureninase
MSTTESTTPAPSVEDVRALDATDPLAAYRDRFLPTEDGVLAYLDGNSLGRPLAATRERLLDLVDSQWAGRLIRGWSEGWMEWPTRVGDMLGEAALGAAPGQVALGDSTTVWFYKCLRAALSARPGRDEIVADTDNFPTDRYVVEAVADELGCTIRWITTDPAAGVRPDQVAEAVGERTAAVTFSHVSYRSAFLADMPEITRIAHDAGALVVWDLCHSVGAVPVALDDCGVDLAVGCTYKFLCAGPGAPAFCYVRSGLQDEVRQPIWGWVGRDDMFGMEPGYRKAPGIQGMLSGTPPVLALAGVEEGAKLVAEAGIEAIRRKGVALADLAITLADAWLAPHGITVDSPRDSARRGAHVTLGRADAESLTGRLVADGVIVDYRAPGGIRVGMSPLSTSYRELWQAMEHIRQVASET